MPTTERLIRETGGVIHLDYRWRWDDRERLFSSDEVRLFRSGKDSADDRRFAEQYGVTAMCIRNIRKYVRYRDVPDIPIDK